MKTTKKIEEIEKFVLFRGKLCFISKEQLKHDDNVILNLSAFFGTIYNNVDKSIIIQSFYGGFKICDGKNILNEIDGFYQSQLKSESSIYYIDSSNALCQLDEHSKLKIHHFEGDLLLFDNIGFIELVEGSTIKFYNQNSKFISEFLIYSLGTWFDGAIEKQFQVLEFSGIFENTLVCTLNNGGILLLDLEKGEVKQFHKDAKVRGGVFQVNDNSPIFLGLKHYTFVEINAESGELLRQVNIEHELKRVANIPAESPCWLAVGTSIFQDGLFYFLGDKNFLGVFDPVTEKIVDYHWFEFEQKGTQLKGGVENLQVKDNEIYCLDTSNTLHVLNRD